MDTTDDVVRPGNVDELSEVIRATAADRPVVRVRGGASKWSWGGVGVDPDVVVDMTGMTAVVEHAAGDLVVTVQAGAPLSDVQAGLAGSGQWLALDPPEPDATIGGVVATAASGPHRLRFGTPRDLLIGVTVVLADGTVARSGGKVVKNVAGYDLGKLFTGSYGTLGVIAQCTFRLHPRPPVLRMVAIATEQPAPIVRELLRSAVTPSAVEWDGTHLHVAVESTEEGAQAQSAEVVALAGGEVSDRLPAGFGARPWAPGELALKLTHRLSSLGAVVDGVRRLVPAARFAAHAASGVVHLGVPAGADVTGTVDALRAEVAAHGGTVVVVDGPDDVKRSLDVWGPVQGLDVMRRIKQQFDPGGRMSPGRFVGGI